MDILDTSISKISESFLNYLHLGAWLDQRITGLVSGKKKRTIDSVANFWDHIQKENLHNGDILQFNNVFVTEWLPKKPGQIWDKTINRRAIQLEKIRKGNKFSIQSSLEHDDHSLGVVRMPFGESNKNFSILSFTSLDSWCCDLGVPLIVSKSVYDAYTRRKDSLNSVEASFQGVLRLSQTSLTNTIFLKSIGSSINNDFLKRLTTPTGIPNVYIELFSPLDVNFRHHDSHPPGFLWIIDREVRNAEVIHHIDDGRVEVIPCDPFLDYSIRSYHVDLGKRDEINATVEAFRNGNMFLHNTEMAKYNSPKLGLLDREILTEFDSRNNYFNTKIKIEVNPWEGIESQRKILNISNELFEKLLLTKNTNKNISQDTA